MLSYAQGDAISVTSIPVLAVIFVPISFNFYHFRFYSIIVPNFTLSLVLNSVIVLQIIVVRSFHFHLTQMFRCRFACHNLFHSGCHIHKLCNTLTTPVPACRRRLSYFLQSRRDKCKHCAWTRWPYCWLLTITMHTFSRQRSARCSDLQDENCFKGIPGFRSENIERLADSHFFGRLSRDQFL